MKKIAFIFYGIITLTFFGILIKLEYATDTYSVFNFSKEEVYTQFAMLGRFITAIIFKTIKIIKMPEQVIYFTSWIVAIICAFFSQYKLYKIIEKDIKNKILKLIIPTLIIINPFSIELFLYIEKGIMWLGILFCIIALENTIRYLENKSSKKNIIYAIIFMFLANCSYQGIIGIYVAIALVYILKYSKNIKQFSINNFIVIIAYGIPAIANFLIVKILYKTSRINGEIIIAKSLEKIKICTIDMYKTMYNLLPEKTLIFLILFTFSIFCCKIWKDRKKIPQFFYIIIVVTFIAIAPQIVQPTASIWFVPRTTYSFASLYGILLLYIATQFELNKFEEYVIIIVSIVVITLQLQKFTQIEKTRYTLNQKDKQITEQIIQQINKYEKQTGNRITEISVYNDQMPRYTYDGIVAIGDVNIKSYSSDWSTVAILNYYLKRELEHVKKDEELEKQFMQQNWNEFNKEQIIFEKNKVNICNY